MANRQKYRSYNNGPHGSLMKSYAPDRLYFLEHTDVVRIYDIDQPMGLVTGIARVAGLLEIQTIVRKQKLSSTARIWSHLASFRVLVRNFSISSGRQAPGNDPDIFNAGPRQTKKCMDAVVRALKWQRIAAPYSSGAQPVFVDSILLSDSMTIRKGETWDLRIPGHLVQSAPASISRGLPLPLVKIKKERPFVVASRHPDGAVSIATLGRFSDRHGYQIPLAVITQQVGTIPSAIGIFGRYQSLTFVFDESLAGKHILAQDMAGLQARDITSQVIIRKNQLTIRRDH